MCSLFLVMTQSVKNEMALRACVAAQMQFFSCGKICADTYDLGKQIDKIVHTKSNAIKERLREISSLTISLNEWEEVRRKWRVSLDSILAMRYENRRKEANATISKKDIRSLVFSHFGYKCNMCGKSSSLTIDHITPVVSGGLDILENLQPLCKSCNSSKGSGGIRRGDCVDLAEAKILTLTPENVRVAKDALTKARAYVNSVLKQPTSKNETRITPEFVSWFAENSNSSQEEIIDKAYFFCCHPV